MLTFEKILARNWKSFPSDLKANSGYLAPVAVFIGIISMNHIGILGKTYMALTFMLLFLITLFIIFWIYSSIPQSKKLTRLYINQNYNLSDLDQLYPNPIKIGVIGISNAGKSTLINKIRQTNSIPSRTTSNNCFIILNRKKHNSYLAFLDGPGDNLPNQIEIIRNSDIIILMIDHNIDEKDKIIDKQRILKLTDYNHQYRNSIIMEKKELLQIHILLNKEDQWSLNDNASINDFKQWFNDEASKFKKLSSVKSVTFQFHSNFNQNSINNLVQHIKI